MRLIPIVLLTLIGFASCGPRDVEDANTTSILFVTTPVQSPALLVRPTLRCFPNDRRMELTMKLESLVPEKITITEISFNNLNGLKSSMENIGIKNLVVPHRKDTTLVSSFKHVNDKQLFHATGLPGLTDSTYNLSVFYTIEGKEGLRVVNLVSQMAKEKFLSYRKEYDRLVQVYVIDTKSGFDEKQKQFLVSNQIANTTPFVHLTEQEVAVSGLNFRIKCFHVEDSLHTEIFVVNHSDLTVKMDTSEINVLLDGVLDPLIPSAIRIEKVTGLKEEATLLAKGERTIITMRQKVDQRPEKILLSFARSFFVSSGKPLFQDDLQLVRFSE